MVTPSSFRASALLALSLYSLPGFGSYKDICGVDPKVSFQSQVVPVTGPTTEIPYMSFTRAAGRKVFPHKCPAQLLLELGGTKITITIRPGHKATYTLFIHEVKPGCALISATHSGRSASLSVAVEDANRKAIDYAMLREFSQASATNRTDELTPPTDGTNVMSTLPAFVSFSFRGTCTGQE